MSKCARCGVEMPSCWSNESCHDCGDKPLSTSPSPPQDPRDSDEATIKRLKAAWDSAHQQAMENGAKYKKAMEALRLVREALEGIKNYCCGEARPKWDGSWETTKSRGHLADVCDTAEYKIKELMGEK